LRVPDARLRKNARPPASRYPIALSRVAGI
jgi:hypothetical protein